jgi:DeoR/GlpR family transcriptional regulator of sugar metabolism
LGNRLAFHYKEKHRIAKLAAASVSPGETVMIESGSCCALLAEVLVQARRDVKIITNSAFIAGFVRSEPGSKVVLLGGDYQLGSQVMVGPLVRLCAEQFYVDKLFIGTDGITAKHSFTNSDMMRAEAVKAMRRQANKVIILTESRKFAAHGVVPVIAAEDVYAVYTDENMPGEIENSLAERSVLVYKT